MSTLKVSISSLRNISAQHALVLLTACANKVLSDAPESKSEDELHVIADGLTSKRLSDIWLGRCSLKTMLENPIDKLEEDMHAAFSVVIGLAKKYNVTLEMPKGKK